MTDTAVEGPAWAPHDSLEVYGGLFPLAVEAHFIATIAKLLPGATTVTTLARQYALHGFLAAEVDARGLDPTQATALLRRCEVVVAGASIMNPTNETPHGYDIVQPRMSKDGYLDVAGLSARTDGYSLQKNGFLGPYVGSEFELGIVAGNGLVPGPRLDVDALRTGFDGLIELASSDRVEIDQLAAVDHLAIGAVAQSPDGVWLRRLMCGHGIAEPTAADLARRDTCRLLARACVLHPLATEVDSFRQLVTHGPWLTTDPVACGIASAQAWRGCLLRHESVGAWRVLWAWLVDGIEGLTEPSELVAYLTETLPSGTFGAFLDGLPSTQDADGNPMAAEDVVRSANWNEPTRSLALLALGARRSEELHGRARDALIGPNTVMGPVWLHGWIEDRRHAPMADVAADLVGVLLDRSKRVALRKMRVMPDGRVRLPTRVHERNGLLYRLGSEGRRNVGLRIEQLARILRALGVLELRDGVMAVTEVGHELLDVSS